MLLSETASNRISNMVQFLFKKITNNYIYFCLNILKDRNIYPKPRTVITFKVRAVIVGIGVGERTLTFDVLFTIFI